MQRIMAYMEIIKPDNGVNVICNYDIAVDLFIELCERENTSIMSVELSSIWCDGYDKEYVVGIDSDYGVWIEKLYQRNDLAGRYLELDPNCLTFVYQNCIHKSVDNVDEDFLIPFCFDDEEELDE